MDKSTNLSQDILESYYLYPRIVDNNLKNTKKALSINCAGHSVYVNSVYASSVRHDYYCFFLTRGKVQIERPILTELYSGDFIIYAPEDHFEYHSDGDFSYYWIHFTGHAASELLESAGITTNYVYHPSVSERSISSIERIFEAFRYRSDMWELDSVVALSEFIAEIGKNILPTAEKNDSVREIAAYIQSNADKSLRVSELSAMAYMSVSGFSAKFKKYYGMSPNEYISAVRINRSSKLLSETELPIEVIAERCGVNDALYFSKIFRKNTGMSPREWRKKNKI